MTEPHDPQQSLPPYPGPPPAAPYGGPPAYQPGIVPQGDPNARPGSVTAAAWISIALSATGLIFSLVVISLTSRMVNYVIDHPEDFDVQSSDLPTADDLRSALTGIAVFSIVASVIAIVVALATLKRQSWARIALTVLSALTAMVSIPLSLGLVGLPWLAGSIAVIVLLFTHRSNTWFRGSGTAQP